MLRAYYVYAKMGVDMARLSIERQKEIDKIISEIPKKTGGFNYPEVGIVDLAKLLGLKVGFVDMNLTADTKYSGAIKYNTDNKDDGAIIFVEDSEPSVRKKFTIAHEIGHFLLHDGARNRLDTINYDDDESEDETEANYFAASLLMPEKMVRDALKEMSFDEMVEYFNVSRTALINRIKWISQNER